MSAPKTPTAPAVTPATSNAAPEDHERIAAATLAWTEEGGDTPEPAAPVAGAEDDAEETTEAEPKPAIAGADEDGDEAEDDKPAKPEAASPKTSAKYREKVLRARQAREEKARRHQQQLASQQREQQLAAKESELTEKLKLLESDPAAYFEKTGHNPAQVYRRMTEQAIKPGEAKIQSQLEQMQQLLQQEQQQRKQELEALQQRMHRERWEQAHEAAKTRFATHSADAKKYPHLSKLSEEERIEYGVQVASDFGKAQISYSDSDVAEALEEYFANLHAALTGTKSTDQGGDDKEAKSGDQAKGGKKPSRTITSDLASQKSSRPTKDISEEARMKAAVEAAQAWANASS